MKIGGRVMADFSTEKFKKGTIISIDGAIATVKWDDGQVFKMYLKDLKEMKSKGG